MMSKRKYTKKSAYWNKFSVGSNSNKDGVESLLQNSDIKPVLAGENYYISNASAFSGGSGSTSRRKNFISSSSKNNRFSNIRQGTLPYTPSSDGVNVRDAIELCQKAYANVPIFRNAIDIMAELANSNICVEGGNEASKKFVEKWFSKINLWSLKDQFFREYYRSGNVFMYRLDGKFSAEDFAKLNKIYGSNHLKEGEIPIRYVLLNPYDIVANRATSFRGNAYKKILSEYELEKLQNPKTEEDKEIFDSLPEDVRKKIKTGGWSGDGVSMDLDSSKLIHAFYKKQDYEPFAIPFGFPVLDDINWKMELKKVDQAISRTIENVILLITMGTDPDKGGINPNNLNAMQSLFQNESVGRVLVSDYTTKAEFILPDISKVIGPEKYKIVNEDITQGLQNVIVGDEKYKNTQVKAEIFLERLKEARQSFMHNFLQPQIKMVCKAMGFKVFPTAKFEEIDIKDEVQLQRVVTRLIEMGILTPEQGVKAIKTGIYPEESEIEKAQTHYIEKRKEGMYNPLVGGLPMVDVDGDGQVDTIPSSSEETNSPGPSSKTPTPKGSGRPVGRPRGTKGIPRTVNAAEEEIYSRKDIQEIIYKTQDLEDHIKKSFAKKMNKDLSDDHLEMCKELTKSIVLAKESNQWKRCANSCIKDYSKIESLPVLKNILDISEEKELEVYAASLLYHSKK